MFTFVTRIFLFFVLSHLGCCLYGDLDEGIITPDKIVSKQDHRKLKVAKKPNRGPAKQILPEVFIFELSQIVLESILFLCH